MSIGKMGPHELRQINTDQYLNTFPSLLGQHRKDLVLEKIVITEKWIYYENLKQRTLCLDPRQSLISQPK